MNFDGYTQLLQTKSVNAEIRRKHQVFDDVYRSYRDHFHAAETGQVSVWNMAKGRIWNQSDLISPYNFAILKTNIELDADKDAALRSISPIYQFDFQVEKQELENFKKRF